MRGSVLKLAGAKVAIHVLCAIAVGELSRALGSFHFKLSLYSSFEVVPDNPKSIQSGLLSVHPICMNIAGALFH